MSRVFAGIHYRFDSAVGLQIAREVTRLALLRDQAGRLLDLRRVG